MSDGSMVRCVVLIPAYQPSETLLRLLRALGEHPARPIIVIDDGSGPAYASVFDHAAALPQVEVRRHQENRGKGAALKTGIQFALDNFPDLAGIVTADADGQHDPPDIERVAGALLSGKGSLILGSRSLQGPVPLRSWIGNVVTRGILHILLGCKLTDTQTGLRGIPVGMLRQLLRLESNGYEFELEMLLLAHHQGTRILEEPILTIYETGNQSSHFNPLVDSMKIYFILLRFASVSLLSAVLDNLVFVLAFRRTGEILTSQALGRVLAVAFNYWMVRRSVFYSHQRHQSTLPKFLILVLASGAASYAGIRWLAGSFAMGAVPAKLMSESALFFVNFAVQRVWIFRPQQGLRGSSRQTAGRWLGAVLWIIFVAALAAEGYGFLTTHLFAQIIWLPAGIGRFWRYLCFFGVFSATVLRFAPRAFIPLVAAIAIIGTVVAAGPAAFAATVLLLVSACALGSRFIEDELLATLAGLGIFILAMLALARVPLHYRWVWAGVLLVPIVLDPIAVARRFMRLARALCAFPAKSIGERATAAVLAFIVGAHWLVVLKPETSADGLAMHLAIPADLALHHVLTYQPGVFLWSMMPMGADWAYSIVYLLGGELATHLLNLAMLLSVLVLLYRAIRRLLPRTAALLLVALFATTPLVQLVTGSLFVENLLAAVLLGMISAVWRLGDEGEPRYLCLAAFLGGVALTVKLGALPFVLVAIPFAVLEARRHCKRARNLYALAIGLLLVSALPTYAIAWAKTGNPVFPFLNRTFPSPLLNHAAWIGDLRYHEPLTWHTPFDLVFRTNRFYEGQDGSFGFQYLLILPMALAAPLFVRGRFLACAAAVGLGSMAAILATDANARYLYASLPVVFVPFTATLAWAKQHQRVLYGFLLVYLIACTALNVYFLPASGWYHKDFYSHYAFRRDARERFLQENAPLRVVVEYYSRAHPYATLLLVSDSDLADAHGVVYENHWHQDQTRRLLQAADTLPQMAELAHGWKLQYFIGRRGASVPPGLAQFLAQCTETEFEHGGYYLARAASSCPSEPRNTF